MTVSFPSMRSMAFRCNAWSATAERNIAATPNGTNEIYPAVEDIDPRTKAKSTQTNGIVEHFHKTMLDEFYRIAFRKKVYATIYELRSGSNRPGCGERHNQENARGCVGSNSRGCVGSN